jgi:hypothetical protein
MGLVLQRHNAREHQRRLMQGLGRPIVSFVTAEGYRMVAVGTTVFWSKTWLTFTEFLLHYIEVAFNREWGAAELAKPESARHPLFHWFVKVREFFEGHSDTAKDGIRSAAATGAVKAYLGLAYDLYLAAHNAELPERLLARLRNRDQFEGAVYEAFVIGSFAKAGLTIEFEDEDDPRTSHCEFTATHKETGRKFSVEAKATTSASARSGAATAPPKIRGQLYKALRKEAAHPRIIFIELSRVDAATADTAPEWVPHVAREIEDAEKQITIDGQPAPPAYVFVTNRSFVHDLTGIAGGETSAAAGFKINDFPPARGAGSILEMHHAREKHIEIYWLLKAIATHNSIPTTFDDRLPEQVFGKQPDGALLIGETYRIPDADGAEVAGILVEAIVLEPEKRVHGIYQLEDGRLISCTSPLTDNELAAYRRSPQTFFGVIKDVGKSISDPLDAFDFFFDCYSKTPRERLLELMAGWPQIDRLQSLDQRQLAEHFCDQFATKMWTDISSRQTVQPTGAP